MQKNITLALSLLVTAALAGTASAVLVSNSLERYAATLLDDRRFAALTPLRHASPPTSLEESLMTMQEIVANTTVTFIDEDSQESKKSPVLTGPALVEGGGVILSADGWIITTQQQLARYAQGGEYAGFVVVRNNERFGVDKIIEDTQTDAVALHVAGAQGWTPIELAENDEILPGATVFALGTLGEVVPVSATHRGIFEEEAVLPAEEPHAFWKLSPAGEEGQAVLSTQGRLFGFINSNGYVVSAQALRPFVRQVLRGTSIAHAALGTSIIGLYQPSSLSQELTQGYTTGVLVLAPTGERTGVVKGGPADKAGLIDGDIILAIDDVRITATTTCADILATYAPGQSVTLRVVRGGEVQDMEVALGTWEELIY